MRNWKLNLMISCCRKQLMFHFPKYKTFCQFLQSIGYLPCDTRHYQERQKLEKRSCKGVNFPNWLVFKLYIWLLSNKLDNTYLVSSSVRSSTTMKWQNEGHLSMNGVITDWRLQREAHIEFNHIPQTFEFNNQMPINGFLKCQLKASFNSLNQCFLSHSKR